MLRATPLAVAALLLLTALPAQADFHGVAWTATGVATDGSRVAGIDIAWGGGLARNVFTIVLKDAVSGAELERTTCLGLEQFITISPISFTSGGVEQLYMFSSCADPDVHFTIQGNQVALLNLKRLHQDLTGSYNAWTFAVATPLSAYQT